MKLQELHNTERPTKWSGHGKMIDTRRNSTYKRPFTQEGNYLVADCIGCEKTVLSMVNNENYKNMILFPSKSTYIMLFTPYMVFVDCIL